MLLFQANICCYFSFYMIPSSHGTHASRTPWLAVERMLGPVATAGVFLSGSVAVHAGTDMARRLVPGWQRRRALQGSKGAEPGEHASGKASAT